MQPVNKITCLVTQEKIQFLSDYGSNLYEGPPFQLTDYPQSSKGSSIVMFI